MSSLYDALSNLPFGNLLFEIPHSTKVAPCLKTVRGFDVLLVGDPADDHH